MKLVGAFEARVQLPRLLSRVEKGETITITRHGKRVARLVPAEEPPKRDIATVIREFRSYLECWVAAQRRSQSRRRRLPAASKGLGANAR